MLRRTETPDEHMLNTLERLADGSPEELVDAAKLVRASRLPVAEAHAALETLRRSGQVELRQETSPDQIPLTERYLYPRNTHGLIGYVRLRD